MIPIIVGIATPGALIAGGAVQRRWRRVRRLANGLLISYLTVVALLAAGEVYFRYFHADTEGRLASDNWMNRYWQTNSLGFRDREWAPGDWAGKTTVAAVGDSFTAGWGIDDPSDRFTNVLAQHLGSQYALFNLGVPGTSTPEQLKTLRSFPVKPNIVILQYFLNDIDYAALSLGLRPPEEVAPEITRESYLADFIYSRFTAGFDSNYWGVEYASYDNDVIWAEHARELNQFIDYVEGIHARLIVVIFPNMQDPVRSIAYVDRVAQVFQASGQHDILKLFDEVAAWSPQDRIISPRDAHPSAAFHHRVGDLLYQQFFAPQSHGSS